MPLTPVSAVIVSWNSAGEILDCIHAVQAAGAIEVIVVDNGSKDQTRQLVSSIPNVQLLYFPENQGFAGGVNRGVEAAHYNHVLILNPDCRILRGLEELAVAAVGGASSGMLLGTDGQLQKGFAVRRLPTPATLIFEVLGLNRLWPSNPVNGSYRCHDFDPTQPQEVEQPPGAFFMIRKDIFQTLGGMDERFWPVWFEDVDYCARLKKNSHKICYTPAASAIHTGGTSVRKISWPFKELAWYGSLLVYATKHFGWLSRRFVSLAVAAASVPRALTGIISRHKGVQALSVYADIFHVAWGSLVYGRVDQSYFARKMEDAEQL
ncbi:MAG: glycosyltransferase family 2 protein [Chloroflexia bacterium]